MTSALAEHGIEMGEGARGVLLRLMPHAPAPELRRVVRDACGYTEQTGQPARRRELPTADIIFIVNLGQPLAIAQPRGESRIVPSGGGFVAGLHDTYTVTETMGSQSGIEVRLSPPGAYSLFGQPMDSIVNRSVALDDLLGRWGADLAARLQEAPGWDCQFAILDAALSTRLSEARGSSPEIVWAWEQLTRSGGRVAIATLADELGWSPRRLIARFREQIGLPPKQVARLLRFHRASEAIASVAAPDWGTLALRHSYYDQSHLINDIREFAGDTPEGLLRRRLPEGGGFAAD